MCTDFDLQELLERVQEKLAELKKTFAQIVKNVIMNSSRA